MGRTLNRIFLGLSNLNPGTVSYIYGASLALGLYPRAPRNLYERSDRTALRKDFRAIGEDMWCAIARAENEKHRRAG